MSSPRPESQPFALRPVKASDYSHFVRFRTDPEMNRYLNGPEPLADVESKLTRDIKAMAEDKYWVYMIVPDAAQSGVVAGNVVIWTHDDTGKNEIGWMVFPEFQGRGLATRAARRLLAMADAKNRFQGVHAYPNVLNAASNKVCANLGFELRGPLDLEHHSAPIRVNDWFLSPRV